MFNLFKKNENTKENNVSLIAVCSLLIHSAKIDENYTEKEKNIIIKALIEMGDPFQAFIYGQVLFPLTIALKFGIKLIC